MLGSFAAAVRGYVTLAVVYAVGVLLASVVIGESPFRADVGGLTGAWMVALLLNTVVASLLAGWVCRRRARDRRAVIVLIAILIGLWFIVVVTDAVIGPTPSGRAFVERLFGPVPADFPLAALLDGQPQMWFALASYALAVVAIVAGGKIAEGAVGATGTPDNNWPASRKQ